MLSQSLIFLWVAFFSPKRVLHISVPKPLYPLRFGLFSVHFGPLNWKSRWPCSMKNPSRVCGHTCTRTVKSLRWVFVFVSFPLLPYAKFPSEFLLWIGPFCFIASAICTHCKAVLWPQILFFFLWSWNMGPRRKLIHRTTASKLGSCFSETLLTKVHQLSVLIRCHPSH